MSTHQRARDLIEQAGRSIMGGNPQVALEELREAILYAPKDAEAYVLLGVALAQVGQPADAENAFRKAIQLAPNNVKGHYNLAVHQYAQGELRNALESAREAAKADALHTGSRELAARIEQELGLEPGGFPKLTRAGTPTEYREGFDVEPSVEAVPFVQRMGPAWTALGWALAAMSLTGLVIALAVMRPYVGANIQADELVQAGSGDPRMKLATALSFISTFGGIAYIAVDAIDRRGNLLWLIPQAICGCTGFTWLIVPIYMRLGRNN